MTIHTRWPVGVTRRTGPTINELGPLRHAATGHRRTPHGKTWRALCGAGVYRRADHGAFDDEHARACPDCVAAARRFLP